MKREFLEKLGLEKDVIDNIMAENGKDIEKYKSDLTAKTTEFDSLKSQLDEANTQIQSFKDMDIDAIKKSADEYKVKFETAQAESQKQLQDLQFNHALDGALGGAKAKNAKAVKALLDMEGLKFNNGEIVGLNEQLEKLKSENDYLFESSEPTPQIMKPTGQTEPSSAIDAVRSAMGLSTKKD